MLFGPGTQVCQTNFSAFCLDSFSAYIVQFIARRLSLGLFLRIYSIRHLYMLWVVVLPICFYIMAFISFYLFICYAFISLMQSFFLFWQLCLSLPFLACYCGRVSTVWLLYRILCLLALGILSDYPQVIHRLSRSSIFCECESDDNIKDSKPILKAISLIICGHGT